MRYLFSLILLNLIYTTLAFGADPTAVISSSEGIANHGIELFKSKVVDNPRDYISLAILAKLYLNDAKTRGDIDSYRLAQSSAQQALSTQPEYIPAQIASIRALMGLHQFTEAKKIVQLVLLKEPNNDGAQVALADILFECGDYQEAEEQVLKLTKEFEGEPSILYREAKIVELHGKNKEAIELLLKAIKHVDASGEDGDSKSWYHLQLGERYLKIGNLKEAQSQYQIALKLATNPVFVYEHLGEVAAIDKKLESAQKFFFDASRLSPRPDLLQAQGDIAALQGNTRIANEFFQKAKEAYERGDMATSGVYAHHLAGLYADSLADADKAIFYARKDFDSRKTSGAYDTLGWALFRAGRYEESKNMIDQAMQWGTQDGHLLYHASMIYGANGDLNRSQELLMKAKNITPYVNSFHIHR